MTDTENPALVTVEELVAIAQRNAAADDQHSYTQVPNFRPHDWVVAALAEAYELGVKTASDRLTAIWKKKP